MTYKEVLVYVRHGLDVSRRRWNDESRLTPRGLVLGGRPASCEVGHADREAGDWRVHASSMLDSHGAPGPRV